MNRLTSCALLTLGAALSQMSYAIDGKAELPTSPPGDAAKGAALYQAKCVACHSADYNGVGPSHRGVFGRAAAQAAGFSAYSPALKKSGLIWSAQSLDRWLTDPEKLVPGQRMGVSVADATERAHLIAYLQSLGPSR